MHQCKLLLDNYTGQYFPGTSIQGRILLNLDTDITLRGIISAYIFNLSDNTVFYMQVSELS